MVDTPRRYDLDEFSKEDIEAFEEAEVSRQMFASIGHLFTGSPLNAKHKRWLAFKGELTLSSTALSTSGPLQRSVTTAPSALQDYQRRPALPERAFSEGDEELLTGNGVAESTDFELPDAEEDNDPTEVPIFLFSETTGAHFPFEAKYDTGSDDNWVSEEILTRLAIHAQKVRKTSYKTLHGKTFASDRIARLPWCSQRNLKMRSSIFHVISSKAPYEVVVGKGTLLVEKLVIFKSGGVAVKQPPKSTEKLEIKTRKVVADAQAEAIKQKREARHAQVVSKAAGEGSSKHSSKKPSGTKS